MNQKFLAGIVLLTGLLLSGVAAYYSIIGLTAIFSGAQEAVVIMGCALEISKLVVVSWLYNNWQHVSFFIKTYMTLAVIILMLITSMGIFGFLSKAHIDQQLKLNIGISDEIKNINNKITDQTAILEDIDKQIGVIDKSVDKLISTGKAKSGLSASKSNKSSREELNTKREAKMQEIFSLKEQKVSLESKYKQMEAEVGPIKYVAELIYGESDEKILDKAVRFVIIILIFVFDPLAIFLMLAFNITINRIGHYNMEFLAIDSENVMKKKRKKRTPREGIQGGDF